MTEIDRSDLTEIEAHFQALISVIPLHPIRHAVDYENAVSALNRLLDAGAASEDHPLADLVKIVENLIYEFEIREQEKSGSNVQAPQKPRYKLADLIAELPPGELPKVEGWDDIKPVGREVW